MSHMLINPTQSQPLVPSYSMNPHSSLQQLPFNAQINSPLLSDTLSPPVYASQDPAFNAFPPYYPHGDATFWEDPEWPSPPIGYSPLDDQVYKQHSADVRRQRRIESERRYRSRTEIAYSELVESFALWSGEVPRPSKKTKEAQLRHATRLIRLGLLPCREMPLFWQGCGS